MGATGVQWLTLLVMVSISASASAYYEGEVGWAGDTCVASQSDKQLPTIDLVVEVNAKSDTNMFSSGEKQEVIPPSYIKINKYYAVKRDRFYVQNTGAGALSFMFEPDNMTSQSTITVPNIAGEFVLGKGNIFWSLDNEHGSQHAINGKSFSAELQLVHFLNTKMSLENAAKSSDGVIVLSILLEATTTHSLEMEALARSALSVGFPNKKWKQVHGPLDLKSLYPLDMAYFYYRGPYTQFPCAKEVHWLVFKSPMSISFSQIHRLRELRKSTGQRFEGVFTPLSTAKEQKITKLSTGQVYMTIVQSESITNGSCKTGYYLHSLLHLLLGLAFYWTFYD